MKHDAMPNQVITEGGMVLTSENILKNDRNFDDAVVSDVCQIAVPQLDQPTMMCVNRKGR